MLRRFGIFAVAAVCAAAAAGQGLSDAERRLNVDSFERVWKTVSDRHWDPKLGGLNWQAVHDELRPKLESAGTMDEARAVISSMLKRLNQTHFGIVPATVYKELDATGGRGDALPGIDIRMVEGRPVVVSVEAGSPAAERGVKTGWQIVKIDGREVQPALERIGTEFAKSTLRDMIQARNVAARLSGKAGETVPVEFLDAADRTVSLELNRVQPRGTVARLGYMPPMYFWTESQKAAPDIGYVRFNMFFEPDRLIKVFEEAVNGCRECRGFIIDLRGNPGGIGGLATGVAGWFTEKAGERLGTMYMRTGTINFAVFPRPQPFRGPLAILVDGSSASTSEIFAGGLQALKRARIFGRRTAGAALPSQFEMLPNGDGFQYAIANYVAEGGRVLEGNGVIPDEAIALSRRQLLDGRDADMEAAVNWIHQAKR